MKRIVFGICSVLLTGSATFAGQAVLIGSTAFRAGPDPHYEVLSSAAAGMRVETLSGTLGWTLVRASNGASGWVPNARLGAPGRYDAAPLERTVVDVEKYTSVVWTGDSGLNLRAGPGASFEVLATMNRGDWVAVTAESGHWARVEHQSGATGWAYRAYLTR